APRHGHSYVDLATAAADVVAATSRTDSDDGGDRQALRAAALDSLVWPEPMQWRELLAASVVVRVVGRHEATPALDDRPLVLHGTHLYTQRQWVDECLVAAALRRKVAGTAALPTEPLADLLDPGSEQYAA